MSFWIAIFSHFFPHPNTYIPPALPQYWLKNNISVHHLHHPACKHLGLNAESKGTTPNWTAAISVSIWQPRNILRKGKRGFLYALPILCGKPSFHFCNHFFSRARLSAVLSQTISHPWVPLYFTLLTLSVTAILTTLPFKPWKPSTPWTPCEWMGTKETSVRPTRTGSLKVSFLKIKGFLIICSLCRHFSVFCIILLSGKDKWDLVTWPCHICQQFMLTVTLRKP